MTSQRCSLAVIVTLWSGDRGQQMALPLPATFGMSTHACLFLPLGESHAKIPRFPCHICYITGMQRLSSSPATRESQAERAPSFRSQSPDGDRSPLRRQPLAFLATPPSSAQLARHSVVATLPRPLQADAQQTPHTFGRVRAATRLCEPR